MVWPGVGLACWVLFRCSYRFSALGYCIFNAPEISVSMGGEGAVSLRCVFKALFSCPCSECFVVLCVSPFRHYGTFLYIRTDFHLTTVVRYTEDSR
jgi:hypothetical protein